MRIASATIRSRLTAVLYHRRFAEGHLQGRVVRDQVLEVPADLLVAAERAGGGHEHAVGNEEGSQRGDKGEDEDRHYEDRAAHREPPPTTAVCTIADRTRERHPAPAAPRQLLS
jgi:hypothetical protein